MGGAARRGARMRPAHAQRAYTLIEVLAVVAMVAILATLAIASYTRWLRWANTAETKDIVVSIATGQHRYFTETNGYLSCSDSYTDHYPMAPNGGKHLFHLSTHPDAVCWRLLAADVDAPTYMGFTTVAGEPGSGIAQPPTEQKIDVPPPADKPWFVVLATGDQDEDGVFSYFMTSSLQPGEVHVENENE